MAYAAGLASALALALMNTCTAKSIRLHTAQMRAGGNNNTAVRIYQTISSAHVAASDVDGCTLQPLSPSQQFLWAINGAYKLSA